MVTFLGQSDTLLLFNQDDEAVIIDSTVSVVVASGATSKLQRARTWDAGEFSETDLGIAQIALKHSSAPEPTGRRYTIPLNVQKAAARAVQSPDARASVGQRSIGALLAAGGQVDFNQLVNISQFFGQADLAHEAAPLYGGEAGKKWAKTIVERAPEAVTASAPDDTRVQYDMTEVGPEFLARINETDGSIDRIYRIDINGASYVWDGDNWDDFGHPEWTIWDYDNFLDGAAAKTGYTHNLIDPESAIYIVGHLAGGPVFVEDIDIAETALAREALPELDLEFLDSTILAAASGGTPGDGVYDEQERSANASQQVRDGSGKFAKQGGRVQVNGVPGATGIITRIHADTGTLEISMDNGGSQIVPAKNVKGVGDYTATIPGKPVEVPRVDFSGILAEPRTPLNRVKGQLPGTLPAMTPADLHNVINNFPAWVKAQREQFKPQVSGPANVSVQKKNSLNTGKQGQKVIENTGKPLTVDAYDHPLLSEWLKKRDSRGRRNSMWYDPITAAAGEAPMTPETSDVQPVYMAVVSPDDPRAVFQLISLVPASATSNSPAIYSREDGQWVRDEQMLNDLNSATPPPVVPLDSDTLNEVLLQVDKKQDTEALTEEQRAEQQAEADAQPLPDQAQLPPGAPTPTKVLVAAGNKPESIVPIRDIPLPLRVLWGTNASYMQQALVAEGGADRNTGGARRLRRYWTKGPGAAKIRWNTPGDWTRCVRQLGKYLGPRAAGYCSLRHKEQTGMWTGDKAHRQLASLRASGAPLYSTQMVASTTRVVDRATLRARGDVARARFNATLSTLPTNIFPDAEDAVEALTASALTSMDVGGAFWMPIALPEGIESGDGRYVEPGAADIRNLPISLLWQFKTASGHDGSVVVGRIERLHRVPGGIGAGYGHFDTGPWGREAERMVRNGMLRFVSADMDNFSAKKADAKAAEAAEDDRNLIEADKMYVKKARVMAVTIVAKPAFQEATIQIVPDLPVEEDSDMLIIPDGVYSDTPDEIDAPALLAAGYIAEAVPVIPPAGWFSAPQLDGPTPLTVDDDGRVFGHIAAWSSAHINPQLSNVNPPRSKSKYSFFHTGVLRTDSGKDVPVGQLTLAGGHADLHFNARDAVKHYDDTGSAVADVHAGEDAFGIWVAGALRPGVTAAQVRAFRASAPSGDWRPIRGNLELVAVCQVNVPGFPIARAFVASGHTTALVAAGAAPLMKLRSNPIAELEERLARVEQFSASELGARADAVRTRMAPVLAAKRAALEDRAASIRAVFGAVDRSTTAPVEVTTFSSDDLASRVASMRARVAEVSNFAVRDDDENPITPNGLKSPDAPDSGDTHAYTPETQPRDYNGRFRDVLARLKQDLGASGNQGVVDEITELDKKTLAGDYIASFRGALHLTDMIDRIDAGAMSKDALSSVRETTRGLGKVLANLPLPFGQDAEKLRFSDLPPVLKDLIDDFMDRTIEKIGVEDAGPALVKLTKFKSGTEMFSQSDVSSELSKLLRLLT